MCRRDFSLPHSRPFERGHSINVAEQSHQKAFTEHLGYAQSSIGAWSVAFGRSGWGAVQPR